MRPVITDADKMFLTDLFKAVDAEILSLGINSENKDTEILFDLIANLDIKLRKGKLKEGETVKSIKESMKDNHMVVVRRVYVRCGEKFDVANRVAFEMLHNHWKNGAKLSDFNAEQLHIYKVLLVEVNSLILKAMRGNWAVNFYGSSRLN